MPDSQKERIVDFDFVCKSCWKIKVNPNTKVNIKILKYSDNPKFPNQPMHTAAQYDICEDCFGEMLATVELKAEDIIAKITDSEIPLIEENIRTLTIIKGLVTNRQDAIKNLLETIDNRLEALSKGER